MGAVAELRSGTARGSIERQEYQGIRGSRARVRIFAQKPIAEAKLLLCRIDDKGEEVVFDEKEMKILPMAAGADGVNKYPAESADYFDLLLGRTGKMLSSYKVAVKDNFGFASAENPRGTIEITQPEYPFVKLLPENWTKRGEAKNEDEILEGIPVPLGGKFMVEYLCRSDIGICTSYRRKTENNRLIEPAWFVYQISDGPVNYLPLKEVPETDKTGRYDVSNATFANLPYQAQTLNDQVPFTARTSDKPGSLPRSEGGGFFEINTDELRKKDADGKDVKLALNDRIEFWIEVYDCDPKAGREPGKSEHRVKTIRTPEEVSEIANNAHKEREAIQELAKRQQQISTRVREKP